MDGSNKSSLYANKVILAPMVRANSLPFRLLCLRFGADLVYSEELIDYRLEKCKRLVNKCLGTIDYVDPRGEVLLRTCSEEKDKLIVQLGSNNPERALRAARLVKDDISGIDFNFGCPKSFSLSGGMGAAMLEKPDEIRAILTSCVQNLDIPITCKMRILPDLDATLKLVKMIESCGVAAIAVHGRTKSEQSSHPNNDECIKRIAETVSIPVIASGGSNTIHNHSDIIKFRDSVKTSSVMIARAAMKNPSIFKSDGFIEPISDIIEKFIKLAVEYDNIIHLTRYTIQALLSGSNFSNDFLQKYRTLVDMKEICDLFNLAEWYDKNKITQDKKEYYEDALEDKELTRLISEKMKALDLDGLELICDNVHYSTKLYGSVPPKAQLMNHYTKYPTNSKPLFYLFQLAPRCYHCIVRYNDKCYLNRTYSNSKRNAEHASAMLACENHGIVELNDYRIRSRANNKNMI